MGVDVGGSLGLQHRREHLPGAVADRLIQQPKSAHPGAKKAPAEIYQAQDKTHAETAARAFAAEYGAKWPKAATKTRDDLGVLLAFYDYPAERWVHLRTTNPIWVFELTCWPRRCFPDWRSARRALTLNAIDAERAVVDSKCRARRVSADSGRLA